MENLNKQELEKVKKRLSLLEKDIQDTPLWEEVEEYVQEKVSKASLSKGKYIYVSSSGSGGTTDGGTTTPTTPAKKTYQQYVTTLSNASQQIILNHNFGLVEPNKVIVLCYETQPAQGAETSVRKRMYSPTRLYNYNTNSLTITIAFFGTIEINILEI